jgi:hypothetical protein
MWSRSENSLSSLLTGNSDLLSTFIYLISFLVVALGFGYFIYWAAKKGAKQAIREELGEKKTKP